MRIFLAWFVAGVTCGVLALLVGLVLAAWLT